MPEMQSARAKNALVFLWFIVVCLAWLGPTLWGRAIFAHDADLAIYYYPIFDFLSTALHSGQSFLWIPSIFSGFPIYLSQSGGFLDPINIFVFSFFDGMTGMHIRLALDIILTVWASYLAARSLGLSRTAALFVGPSYLLSIHMRYFTNPITANTLFLLPLLMYTTHSLLRGALSPLRAGVLAGIGLGWALLAGYTQLIVYAILYMALFTLGHLLWQKSEWKRYLRSLVSYGAITLILGIAIGLPFLLPAQKHLALSARTTQASFEEATLKAMEVPDLLLTVVPDYLYFPYITSGRIPLYVGTLWFLMALGAVIISLRKLRRPDTLTNAHKGIVVAASVSLFALIAAYKWSPIFWAMTYLPIVGLFRFPFRYLLLGTFFFAILGGYGFDMVREVVRDRAWRFVLWVTTTFTGLFLAWIAALNIGGDALIQRLADIGHAVLGATVYGLPGFTKDPAQYRLAIENGLQAYREFFSFSDVGVVAGVGVLVISCGVLVAIVRGWLSDENARRMCIAVVTLTCICIPMSQWTRFVTSEEVGMRPQALNAYAGEDVSRYRMYSFLPTASARTIIPPQYKLDREEENAMHDVWIMGSTPNFHLYSGISSLDGYDQFEPTDYLFADHAIGGEYAAGYGAGTDEERIGRLLSRLDLFGMMGGRYIVVGLPLQSDDLTLIKEVKVSSFDIPIYIYEYEKARPIFYLATTTTSRPHAGIKELLDASLAFDGATYLDCENCSVRVTKSAGLTLVERKNGRYVFTITTSEERYLILSESLLPGWTLTIDDAASDLIRANGLYMAARVPPGEHTVTFEYQGVFKELHFLKAIGLVR